MSMKILGWYNRANCGDDAFVLAFSKLFPGEQIEYFEPTTGPLQVENGQRLILGGGDVIKDYYLQAIDKNIPFSIIGCGLGYETEVRQLAQYRVLNAVLRNPSDVELCKSAGINAVYAPDICFALDPVERLDIQSPKSKKKLGVILSGHAAPGLEQPSIQEASYFEFLQWELGSTLDELAEWFDIHWISFSSDPDAWDETPHYGTRRKMVRRPYQHFWPYESNNPAKQIQILSSMDLIITMKFHGAIFATINGIPFVTIAQTRKLQEYGSQFDLEHLTIPAYSFTKKRALSAVKSAEASGTKEKLLSVARRNQSVLVDQIRRLKLD